MKMKFESIDDIDLMILRFLSKNGKTTYTEIANETEKSQKKVSAQTISDRVEKLQKKGIIKRFTIEIDPIKVNFPIEFICELDINASVMDDVIAVLKEISEIHIIKITTGIHDILCIGNVSSIENLHEVVERKISTMSINVGKNYLNLKRYDKALKFLERGLLFAEKTKSKSDMRDSYEGLHDLYKVKGDFKKALEYYELFYKTDKQIFNEKSIKQINEIQVRYDTMKKEKDPPRQGIKEF